MANVPDHVFDTCTGITGMTFPDTVESIGKYAFSGFI